MDDHDEMQVEDIKKSSSQASLPAQANEDQIISLTKSENDNTKREDLDTMFDDDELDNYNEEEEEQKIQAPIERLYLSMIESLSNSTTLGKSARVDGRNVQII